MAFSILYIHTIPQIDSHIQSLTPDSESVVLYINSEVNNASVQPLTKKKIQQLVLDHVRENIRQKIERK